MRCERQIPPDLSYKIWYTNMIYVFLLLTFTVRIVVRRRRRLDLLELKKKQTVLANYDVEAKCKNQNQSFPQNEDVWMYHCSRVWKWIVEMCCHGAMVGMVCNSNFDCQSSWNATNIHIASRAIRAIRVGCNSGFGPCAVVRPGGGATTASTAVVMALQHLACPTHAATATA